MCSWFYTGELSYSFWNKTKSVCKVSGLLYINIYTLSFFTNKSLMNSNFSTLELCNKLHLKSIAPCDCTVQYVLNKYVLAFEQDLN